jgi:mannan endo-1,4-beta-mannosidase
MRFIRFIPCALMLAAASCATHSMHFEAEDAQLNGVVVASDSQGYSGTGYVTGIDDETDSIVFRVQADLRIYDLHIRYRSPADRKGYTLNVNGLRIDGIFPKTGQNFVDYDAGLIELSAGQNSIAIERGWGYYDVDSIDIASVAQPRPPRKPPNVLVDRDATPETRALFEKLIDLYGKKTLSGSYRLEDFPYIQQVTGQTPAVLGGDLVDYSPSRIEHGVVDPHEVEKLIDQHNKGEIISLMWHWNAPKDLVSGAQMMAGGRMQTLEWWSGFYTKATNFNVEFALDHPDSDDYKLMLRDIDAIAVQLKRLQDAKVPILWRPLHEAEGQWFWWGAHGPAPFIKLYRLMYDRLVNYHHIHDLIWVYTSAGDMSWYPGDDVVDIIGIDAYPADFRDPQSALWQDLIKRFDGKKLLTISEYGGVPDVPRMHRIGAFWSYFITWIDTDNAGPHKDPPDELRRIYNDPAMQNRLLPGN